MKTLECFHCHRRWSAIPVASAIVAMVRRFNGHECKAVERPGLSLR